ncbi:MAG TPA: hypothetical protein VGM64_20725 [Lacunisphaera sp.]|jgi:hypothetical protein
MLQLLEPILSGIGHALDIVAVIMWLVFAMGCWLGVTGKTKAAVCLGMLLAILGMLAICEGGFIIILLSAVIFMLSAYQYRKQARL